MKNLLKTNIESSKGQVLIKSNPKILRYSFILTGIAFLITCLLGYVINVIIDKTGVLKDVFSRIHNHRFDIQFLKNPHLFSDISQSFAKMMTFFYVGLILSIICMIFNFIWASRVAKASKGFIILAFTLSVLSQSIGLGFIFTIFLARDLLIIFGISGALFLTMAVYGFFAKNLSSWSKFIIIGSIVAICASLIVVILYFVGIYNDTFYMMVVVFSGIISLAMIAYQVWVMKHFSFGNLEDEEAIKMMYFRFIAFFAFILYLNLMNLIMIVARLYARSKL